MKKTIQEEAMDTLKAMAPSSPSGESKGPPSPVQAFLGAVSAGVIALILYKFATTVEASLNRQTISDSFSVRNSFPHPLLHPLLDSEPCFTMEN